MRGIQSTLAALVFLGAGTGVRAQGFGEPEKFELRGRVIDVVTGEPVGGALVELFANGKKVQFTSLDGSFAFEELMRGNYTVIARKPGYFNERDLGVERADLNGPVMVPGNGETVLKLTPEGVIYGRVADEEGKPIEGIQVGAERWTVQNGTRRLLNGGQWMALTDDEGNFRIANLTPGDYLLKFMDRRDTSLVINRNAEPARVRRGNRGQEQEKDGSYGTQYYPGGVSAAMASPIALRAGATVPIQERLEPVRLHEISGVVRGVPAGEAFQISLLGAQEDSGDHGRTEIFPKTGEFRVSGVPPGKYLLRAAAQQSDTANVGLRGRRLRELIGQMTVDVNSDIAGVVLLLGGGTSVAVRLQDEGGGGHRVQLTLQSKDFPELGQNLNLPLPATDLGSPRGFEGLAAGTYTVDTWTAGWGYVASLRCGGVDLLKEDLVVGAGVSVQPIEVRLSGDGAELNVNAVEKGKPVAGRVVVYSEEYPKRSAVLMTWPGSVTPLSNLAPGTYKLIATRGVRELEYRNPAAMAKYLSRATTVTLAPEAKLNVQVEVQDEEPEP